MIKCVFVLVNGKSAKFISGLYHSGYIDETNSGVGVSKEILLSKNQDDFLRLVKKHLDAREPFEKFSCTIKNRWSTFRSFDFIYAFFGGHVWVTSGLHRYWYNPFIPKKKWPKSTPPAPIRVIGQLRGEVTAICGYCGHTKTVPIDWIIRKEKAFVGDTILSYFEDIGFRKCRGRGFLCRRCQRKFHLH